jgi:pyruvate-ferredoxin/flavodoxin oxidoreductase
MTELETVMMDGNEAAAQVAHMTNEVIAIYPITPASPMGEHSDAWSEQGRQNIWGTVPSVIEMQSEGGAAGAIHGALQAGALTTTFTASQGLLLMLPNMYKIAGELSPTVIHVSARSLAAQALSIFCDHSDVMAARATGFAMLCANSVQEVMDMTLISQVASLRGRVPVLHFFDGFRTSHEIAKVCPVTKEIARQLIDDKLVQAHRERAMTPERPSIRGTSQNPDVYFQARESVNPYYAEFPNVVQQVMDDFAELTGRHYRLFQYEGSAQAKKVIIVMGSAAETVEETVASLVAEGEEVGVLKVRLFRPLSSEQLISALPSSVEAIAVLDRTKEPGSDGEPLYKDVVNAVYRSMTSADPRFARSPVITGGRYGLSSKEFTPVMVRAIFDELDQAEPKPEFTIGIQDDLSHLSLNYAQGKSGGPTDNFEAVFYGLGSDGTVSANKNAIKIIGEETDQYAQGYFVYDSKKSGAVTVSHLRFGPNPIKSAYLIGDQQANFVACHQSIFLNRFPMLDKAAEGATFLLNTSVPLNEVWQSLPESFQQQIITKKLKMFVIDGYKVAEENGLGKHINTVMQTCFFAVSGVLPQDEAIARIKDAVVKTYGRKSRRIVEINHKAIEATLENLHEFEVPSDIGSSVAMRQCVPKDAPEFVQQVTGEIIAGRGDLIPVRLLPADGTYPVGTAAYEKRDIALEIPQWEEDLCTHCGKCVFVCPHSVIRSKAFDEKLVQDAPESFKHVHIKGKDYPEGVHIAYQVSPLDCTGCSLCVDICPIRDKSNASRKAINMVPKAQTLEQEVVNWNFFEHLPEYKRSDIKVSTMKGAMLMQPLFEFSGACVGCGETSYIRLASQLFGDRMLVANATGCSSIYGGNLPTTPWTANAEGRGPSWNNSLFEDNAEFGLGMRLAVNKQGEYAAELLLSMKEQVGAALADAILNPSESDEQGIYEQRERVANLRERLKTIDSPQARELESVAENLCRKSVWIIGGDGWAYDIGFGGLDHVLSSGQDVNVLVLDTEVYSNTGGQTSKATPKGAVAKFSAGGRATSKKDLALMAMNYGNVYVAQVAYGAKDVHTLHVLQEAEAYPGPSLIIAYSPCIAHGVDLKNNHRQQNLAVDSGHWNLLRFDPRKLEQGQNPLHLDSKVPSVAYSDFALSETRFSMLAHTNPQSSQQFIQQAQKEVMERYQRYADLAAIDAHAGDSEAHDANAKHERTTNAQQEQTNG